MNRPLTPNLGPYATTTITLLHWLPTRLRLEIPIMRDGVNQIGPQLQVREVISKNAFVEMVESTVTAVEGVTRAEANPLTGTLLIEHDGQPGREVAILQALCGILSLVPPLTSKPRLLTSLNRLGMGLNQVTLWASKGWIDLEAVLPLLLAIYGFSELFVKGRFQLTPSLMILWRAYTNLRDLAHDPGR